MQYETVAENIYRDEKGRLYERCPELAQRALKRIPVDSLEDAKLIVDTRRRRFILWQEGVPGYTNPYAEGLTRSLPKLVLKFMSDEEVGLKAGGLSPVSLENQSIALESLVEWPEWDELQIEALTIRDIDRYAEWRRAKGRVIKGASIDVELGLLRKLIGWGVRRGYFRHDPFVNMKFPSYYRGEVEKCRDHQPEDAEELHAIAYELFKHPRSVVLGFQYLWEAFTGMRTSETIKLRRNAAKGEHGYIDMEKGYMFVNRSKKGVNPYIRLTPEVKALLDGMEKWLAANHPRSKYFFPSPECDVRPVTREALTHALKRVSKSICNGRRLTSHGARAFYVRVRQSHMVPNAKVSYEIGDKSGESIIVSTYGKAPPNWGDESKGGMTFIPESGSAWERAQKTCAWMSHCLV